LWYMGCAIVSALRHENDRAKRQRIELEVF
jgi:hypothetical protein